MPQSIRLILLLAACALAACLATGCSDDDDPVATQGPTDNVAPVVAFFNPGEQSYGVGLDEAVTVRFTEAMDTGSADGQVTLSSGGTPVPTWNAEGTELSIGHDAWPAGTPVTVTVGTGLKDEAGNALPQAFTVTFYTASPAPVLMDTRFPGGDDAMITNGSPVLVMSEPMDLVSVLDNTVITEGVGKRAVPGFEVGTDGGDPMTVAYRFLDPLSPLTTYTITIDGAAETAGGATLGDPVEVTFTTGTDADETPPVILSTVPAADAVVSTDLASVTVNFSEPVDPESLRPTEIAALLEWFVLGEPVWNAERDALTLYLQRPLPAGVDLYAVFEPYTIHDLAGNANTETQRVAFTTAGTAGLMPLREDLRVYYRRSGDHFSETVRQTFTGVSGSNGDRLLHTWGDDGFDTLDDMWHVASDASGVRLRGFGDEEGSVMLSPPAEFLKLPVPAQWSGTATADLDTATVTLAYTVTDGGVDRYRVSGDYDKVVAPTAYYLDDVQEVTVEYGMTVTGEPEPFETGTMQLYFCPGLGIAWQEDWGWSAEDGSWASSLSVIAAALDDRWEERR